MGIALGITIGLMFIISGTYVEKKSKKFDGEAAIRFYEPDVAYAGFMNGKGEFHPVLRIKKDKDIGDFMKAYGIRVMAVIQD